MGLGNIALTTLSGRLDGYVVTPADETFDDVRRVWNGAVDRRPAVIARCRTAKDVSLALAYAQSADLPVVVRGGGHSVAGLSTCDGGMMIDLSLMKRIEVDAVGKRVTAQAGVPGGELDAATQQHGLGTTLGTVSHTGIARTPELRGRHRHGFGRRHLRGGDPAVAQRQSALRPGKRVRRTPELIAHYRGRVYRRASGHLRGRVDMDVDLFSDESLTDPYENYSISNALWLFGSHPGQWQLLRSGGISIPMAYNESLRFESPVYAFSRRATKDVEVGDRVIPRGARVAVLYGSANRDETKWTDPDAFDLNRRPADHLAFGFGVHGCAGQGLARLEVHALLQALVQRVGRIEVADPARRLNNVIRGLASLDVTLVPA